MNVKLHGESYSVRDVTLPPWAKVSDKRRKHIVRVVDLLFQWAGKLEIGDVEHARWMQAGTLHDALRDAPEEQLRELTGDATRDTELLHGPAVAALLEREGETDRAL